MKKEKDTRPQSNLMHFFWYVVIVILPLFGPMFLLKSRIKLSLLVIAFVVVWQNILIWFYHIYVTPRYQPASRWVLGIGAAISFVLYALWLGLI